MTSERARAGIDVHAGLVPGQPEPEFSRSWFLTERQWSDAPDQAAQDQLLVELAGKATAHGLELMRHPERLNWVKVEWVWF